MQASICTKSTFSGHGPGLAGAPPDKNVELRLQPSFPLRRLAGE